MESPLEITVGARMSSYLVNVDDFQKQRLRVNKQLSKLRHDLNIVTSDTKNYSTKEKSKAIDSSMYNQDYRNGLLLLLTAERDVLHAYKIKSLLEMGNQSSASYKNLMVSKIKKALQVTKKLLHVTKDEKDKIKQIELYVYAALIQGFLSVTKKQWSLALNAFSIARCCLELLRNITDSNGTLPHSSASDEESQFRKTLFNEILDSTVNPSLNLAISQDDTFSDTWASDLKSVSRKHCQDGKLPFLQPAVEYIKEIDPSFVTELNTSVELIDSIEWRGHTARLNNNEIAFKIMSLNGNESNLSTAEDYDAFAQSWADLLDIHNNEQNVDEDDHDAVQERAILSTFLSYNFMFAKLKRDLCIIEQTKNVDLKTQSAPEKNRVIYRLLDAAVSTTQDLKDLPGVYNDEELYESLNTLEIFFAAKKNFTLAELYAFNEKFTEALVVFNHVKQILEKQQNLVYSVEFPYQVSTNANLKHFVTLVNSKTFQAHVLAQFNSDMSSDSAAIENINKYPESLEKVLPFKNGLKTLLSKPVLFDIGFNYINYDTGRSNIREQAQTAVAEESKKSGFFGIFGRS